jgi:hypothetical protein
MVLIMNMITSTTKHCIVTDNTAVGYLYISSLWSKTFVARFDYLGKQANS